MSRRSCVSRTLSALAALWLAPHGAHADSCSGLVPTPLAVAPVGTGPTALAAGDFNRDGKLDLAVVNSATNDVSILLGDGAGGFTAGAPVSLAATNPVDVAVGDLDHDGLLDIVVAFGSSAQVQLLRGQAGALFGNAGLLTLGPTPFSFPTRILLGRLTSDADPDLVVLYDAGQRIRVYRGSGLGFVATPVTDLSTAGETMNGGTLVDFNRDGKLDVAVAIRNRDTVRVYLGDGTGGLGTTPQLSLGVGAGPVDVAAGDVDRDGWPDLVTADSGAGTVTVAHGKTKGSELESAGNVAAGSVPTRVALSDLDHNGILDLAVLDNSATPRLTAFGGQKTAPFFDPAPYPATLAPASDARGLVVGAFSGDGRDDLAVVYFNLRQAVVVEDGSGMPCAKPSFAKAPRSYPAGNGPVASAAADFDHDGRTDLVVASANDSSLRILRNVDGGFTTGTPITGLSPTPRGVAVADLNIDGHMDVVVAQGAPGSGRVQLYLGNGAGALAAGAFQVAGDNLSAVAVGDVNGDGAPDVVAASEGSGQVFVFLGNGAGAIGPGSAFPVGAGPHALVAADLDGNGTLDLAVANSSSNNVTILFGNGDGTFALGPVLAVGVSPLGIAAADLDGDGRQDLVTADNGSAQVSIILRNGTGGFLPAVPYTVGMGPTAVALLNLEGNVRPDIVVSTSGSETLVVLVNNGNGGVLSQNSHTLRSSPQAITPIDADSDGLVDLAIPCRSADAVVVLVNRPPGPPVLQSAPRVAVHDAPRAAVSGDFDGDGILDLAVVNSGTDNSISLLRGDGVGGFTEYLTLAVIDPEAIVAGDWNGDGRIDLAVSSQSAGRVAILFGSTTVPGKFDAQPSIAVGSTPDDLVAGDLDGDGDLDLAVCDKVGTGAVNILRNDGAGVFTLGQNIPVGKSPTAIAAADFDRDGDLDLAVANDDDNNVVILRNSAGSFNPVQALALGGGDTSPVSLTVGDFDGDGRLDLVAAAGDNDHLHLYRNLGASFATPSVQFDVPYVVRFVTTADVNLDGKPDLVAVADGLSVLRGKGGLDFETAQTVVARYTPSAAVIADFDRDGRTDVVVLDEGSDEITLLRSTACEQQRLEVSLQPNACATGAPPFPFGAQATAFDEGGNVAMCASGSVSPAIVPGTGDPLAVLGGPASRFFANGVADFTGANGLTLDKTGRYKLQFTAVGMPLVQTRSFTLAGAGTLQIVGPASVCPGGSGTYTASQSFDSYAWTRTPPGAPAFAFTPAVVLSGPPLAGSYTLDLVGRDECQASASRSLYFGDLATSVLSVIGGASTVCVNCIGGSAKAIETGGGSSTRQWGFRTVSTSGTITALAGETADTYVLKGASFPGPGTYYVVFTTTPQCGTPKTSNEWAVTVIASVPTGEVQHLAASSRGTAASGENQLLWVNSTGSADEIRIRWNQAPAGTSSCLPPASITATFDGEAVITTPSSGSKDDFLHTPVLIDTAYCYSVFVKVSGVWSPGRTVKARAFDATTRPGHSLKWAYATGGTAIAPPTVSGPGILAMSNDRTVHSLTRGSLGGLWPAPWVPTDLTGVAHSRSPVVPFVVPLAGADTVLFAADDAAPGFLHAIDARTGVRPWPAQSQGLTTTGAPGGLFTQYGGVKDLLFVGTRDMSVNNELRALKLADGSLDAAYTGAGSPGPIGPINGTPAVDYATGRLYFASWTRAGGDTLFCLEIKASPTFTYKWSRNLGNISGSPVLRGGRIYVGTDAGLVYSLDAATGGDDHTILPADGPVKGFLFPDRRNSNLIFATDTKVWSVADGASSITPNWSWTISGLNPSVILYWPQTNLVYVGSANGKVYELDFSAATLVIPPTFKVQVLGDGTGQVGAPSIDIAVTPRLLLVGSEPGVLYGLEAPFQ